MLQLIACVTVVARIECIHITLQKMKYEVHTNLPQIAYQI